MEIVPSTFLALAAVLAMLLRGPYGAVSIFMALMPFGAAAAFNLPALGGASIGVADLGAVAILGLVCLLPNSLERIAGTMRPWQPGFFLLLLALVCVIAALFLPRIFAGQTEVFGISRSEGQIGIVRLPLTPGTGNITQLFRMVLGFLTFFALATILRRKPDEGLVLSAMITCTLVQFALGWIDVTAHAVGLPQILDPIRTANYSLLTEARMGGMKRMVGGFPEASSFGFLTLGLFGFWLQVWIASPASRAAPWMFAASTILLVRSTSSAAYVAAAVFLVTFAVWTLLTRLRRTARRRSVAIAATTGMLFWVGALIVFGAYQLVSPVTEFLDNALFNKMGTSSGVERMSWNSQAWINFTDTLTFGAGLGSVRASSWFMACLGSIGLIGTGLYIAFLLSFLRLSAPPEPVLRTATLAGLKSGCLALLLSAMLTHATPDLGVIFFALSGLAAGLSRGALLESQPSGNGIE
ncbi:hypothetical protein [Aliiruegeria lutimaris]|uniref:O-Antigen ligase n=1 Tax=Aliiruegeria lutimaris TaxID=571298 RepID=A0A1G9HT77_9RHOB|nr:hypothetical protein [Aliiruegeria lutimaris]SDL16016.1 hypothetical protein SAMN04488026_107014 [Aliiruegeria lutimaris]